MCIYCVCVYMCVYMCVYVCICVYMCVYVCMCEGVCMWHICFRIRITCRCRRRCTCRCGCRYRCIGRGTWAKSERKSSCRRQAPPPQLPESTQASPPGAEKTWSHGGFQVVELDMVISKYKYSYFVYGYK